MKLSEFLSSLDAAWEKYLDRYATEPDLFHDGEKWFLCKRIKKVGCASIAERPYMDLPRKITRFLEEK